MPKISIEATIGLLIEVAVGILDHLHIGERWIIWGLFAFGLILLSDAVIRSDWAKDQSHPRTRLKRRILGMIPVLAGAVVFGFLIFGRAKTIEGEPKGKSAKADQLKAAPELSILGYEVILFKPNMNPFANVFFQNIGDKGQITVYSSSGLTLTTADVAKVKKELEDANKTLVSQGGGLVFSVEAQEKRWFTVMGPTLSTEQEKLLRDGKYFFYFSGTIVVHGDESRNHSFCNFVKGNRPNVVLQCPEN